MKTKDMMNSDIGRIPPYISLIAPAIGAALIGGGISLVNGISNLFGASSAQSASEKMNRENNDAALQRQREYNDFQLNLMNAQNDWNLEQWNRNNEYNSPLAQRKRLESAGINPMLAGIDGGLSNSPVVANQQFALESPSDALSAAAQQTQAQQSMMSAQAQMRRQAVNDMLQGALSAAQIRNINADTDKKTAETTGKNLENETFWTRFGLQVKSENANIDLRVSETFRNHADTKRLESYTQQLIKSLDVMDSQIAINQQQIENLKSQKSLTDEQARHEFLENLWKTETWNQSLAQLQAITRCTDAQAKKFLSDAALSTSQAETAALTNEFLSLTMQDRVYQEDIKGRKLFSEAIATGNQANLIHWNAKREEFGFNFDVDNKETLATLQMITGVVGATAAVVGAGAMVTKQMGKGSVKAPVNVGGYSYTTP